MPIVVDYILFSVSLEGLPDFKEFLVEIPCVEVVKVAHGLVFIAKEALFVTGVLQILEFITQQHQSLPVKLVVNLIEVHIVVSLDIGLDALNLFESSLCRSWILGLLHLLEEAFDKHGGLEE